MANRKPLVISSGRPANIPNGDSVDLSGADVYIILDEHSSSPATPPAGTIAVYGTAAGALAVKDDAGAETVLGAGGGGGAEPANQIVFGTGASVDSDPDFTYDPALGQLWVNTIDGASASVSVSGSQQVVLFGPNSTDGAGGGIQLVGGDGAATFAGGQLSFRGGTAGAGAGNGGHIELLAGEADTGLGGSISITAGASDSGTGGDVNVLGGETFSTGVGGAVTIMGGYSIDVTGGNVTVQGGGVDTGTAGGNVSIFGGVADVEGFGGEVLIVGGDGVADTNPDQGGGNVTIQAGVSTGAATLATIVFNVNGDTPSVVIDPTVGYIVLYSNNGSIAGVIGETYSTGDGGQGGGVDIVGGRATGTNDVGGTAFINGGFSELGNGGIVEIGGGTSDVSGGSGGDVTIIGGLAQGGGASTQGSVFIATEAPGSGETAGSIVIRPLAGHAYQTSGGFVDFTDARSAMYVLRRTTTSASQTREMFLDGDGALFRMLVPTDSTWKFEVHIVARDDTAGDSAGYQFAGVIENVGGTTAIVGSVQTIMTPQEDDASWDAVVSADDTNDALIITVTGDATNDTRWVAFVRTVEVTG